MMVWALVLGLCAAGCLAQGDYYKNIDPTAKDSAMLDQLFALLNPHTAISYDQVWTAFREIDNKKYDPPPPAPILQHVVIWGVRSELNSSCCACVCVCVCVF